MLFAIVCTDKPGCLETRKATRERHLAYLERWKQHLVHGGPLLDAENRPCGSLLVVDVADRAAAEALPPKTRTPRWNCSRAL